MTFWQENYAFIKDVYDMRHHKMAEWIENVEKVTTNHIVFSVSIMFKLGHSKNHGRQSLHLS